MNTVPVTFKLPRKLVAKLEEEGLFNDDFFTKVIRQRIEWLDTQNQHQTSLESTEAVEESNSESDNK